MKYNWKKELKQLGMDMLDGAYSWLCMAIVSAGIIHFQTEENINLLKIIIQPQNFSMVALVFTGVLIWGMTLRLIINYTFKFVMFIFRVIIKINTKPDSDGPTIST